MDSEIVYLNVPYDQKEYVKTLGGMWSPSEKRWYCYDHHKILVDEFSKPIEKPNKIYLYVPFEYKDNIKKYNGKFDKEKKQWYILDDNKEKEYLQKVYHRNNFYSLADRYHMKDNQI